MKTEFLGFRQEPVTLDQVPEEKGVYIVFIGRRRTDGHPGYVPLKRTYIGIAAEGDSTMYARCREHSEMPGDLLNTRRVMGPNHVLLFNFCPMRAGQAEDDLRRIETGLLNKLDTLDNERQTRSFPNEHTKFILFGYFGTGPWIFDVHTRLA